MTNGITRIETPSYLKKEGLDDGGSELKQFVVPPRIKVVQKQAKDELLARFNVGDVIVSPHNIRLSEMEMKDNQPTGDAPGFRFTPIFFFLEWITWNPIESNLPAIRERTIDRHHHIALKSQNPGLRREMIDGTQVRHVEHMNFIVYVYDLFEDPCVLSFSRGDHTKGRAFAGLWRMRKAPLYGCVFHAHLSLSENKQGSWWSHDIINPPGEESPWVPEADFEKFKSLHEEFKSLHESGKVRVEHEAATTEVSLDA